MKKKPTVTIGIPAYNEEANIGKLLKALIKQKVKTSQLERILIISDGSSDDTVKCASLIKDGRIEVVDRKKRLGGRQTKNEILQRSTSDILVILDADVLPSNTNFVEEISKPIIEKRASLVGADTIPLPAKGFVERTMAEGHLIKKRMYRRINQADNVYLCHGRARAFSKDLYKKICFPDDCPEDAYSYLYAKYYGHKFIYSIKANVFFRTASSLEDKGSQSKRFLTEIINLKRYFPENFIRGEFKLPLNVIFTTFLFFFLRKPATTFFYLIWIIYLHLNRDKTKKISGKWQIATSSKSLQ